MNTHVNFETAKLLKEKGFYIDKSDTLKFYHDENTLRKWDSLLRIGICPQTPSFDYTKIDIYQAPTIAEVVMWLYEKHGIWIQISNWINQPVDGEIWEKAFQWFINGEADGRPFRTPTEAYQEAINYTLKNLI